MYLWREGNERGGKKNARERNKRGGREEGEEREIRGVGRGERGGKVQKRDIEYGNGWRGVPSSVRYFMSVALDAWVNGIATDPSALRTFLIGPKKNK